MQTTPYAPENARQAPPPSTGLVARRKAARTMPGQQNLFDAAPAPLKKFAFSARKTPFAVEAALLEFEETLLKEAAAGADLETLEQAFEAFSEKVRGEFRRNGRLSAARARTA